EIAPRRFRTWQATSRPRARAIGNSLRPTSNSPTRPSVARRSIRSHSAHPTRIERSAHGVLSYGALRDARTHDSWPGSSAPSCRLAFANEDCQGSQSGRAVDKNWPPNRSGRNWSVASPEAESFDYEPSEGGDPHQGCEQGNHQHSDAEPPGSAVGWRRAG